MLPTMPIYFKSEKVQYKKVRFDNSMDRVQENWMLATKD